VSARRPGTVDSGATAVYAVVGQPVAHSLSPRLMNHALDVLGEDAVYVALPADPERPDAVADGLAALGVAGVNVTYPLKQAVLPFLAQRSLDVVACEAANVLVRVAAGWRGENTDAPGVPLALQALAGWEPAGRTVVILGAGGAARAAAHGLLQAGAATVRCLARDADRAQDALAPLLVAHPGADLAALGLDTAAAAAALAAAELVVQATPVGLTGADAPAVLAAPDQAPRAAALELVYGAAPTAFEAAWRAAGRTVLGGRDVLAAQGHLALRLWLGRAPDLAAMRRTLDTEEPA
jgi:shikimate dehydrogenase